ncbi:MAG: radical SAM protein [Vicinamibacterales bacterium]
MRVLFSNPPWYTSEGPEKTSLRGVRAGSRWPHQFEYRSAGPVNGHIPELIGGYIPFPVFLATAAALAKKHGHESEMRDSVASGETYEHYYAHVEALQPQAVVIETSTPTIRHDIGVVNEIRKRVPNVTVIFSGMHFELEEASFLERYPQVDFTVYGEYEFATVTVLDRLQKGETDFNGIEGLVYRSNGAAVKAAVEPVQAEASHDHDHDHAGGGCGTGAAEDTSAPKTLRLLKKDDVAATTVVRNDFKKLVPMETLPWAERDGLPMENYYDGVCGLQRPQLQLMATRGCPYGCIFCGWPQMIYRGPKYRVRTVQDVVAEIKANLEKVPYKSFYIDDDTVNIRKQYILDLAKAIKEAGLHTIPWGTMGRADLMDEEMILALKDAGLFSIKYGVETADQELLNEIKKNIKIDEVIKGIELTKKHGIKVHLTFTFGLPSDTPETIERTIQLACRLPVDTVQFSITTPYPGTEMYRMYKKNGWLLNENWEEYLGSHRAVARTANFTAEQLEDAVKQAYSRFWEEQALRQLRTPAFEQRLRDALPAATAAKPKVLVTQSARPGLTRVVLHSLAGLGFEPHVLTHERFEPSFQSDFTPDQIHVFRDSFNFDAEAMAPTMTKLVDTNEFVAVVVPYHNATGANYDQVHAVAAAATAGPIVGVTVHGDVLRPGTGHASRRPATYAVA